MGARESCSSHSSIWTDRSRAAVDANLPRPSTSTALIPAIISVERLQDLDARRVSRTGHRHNLVSSLERKRPAFARAAKVEKARLETRVDFASLRSTSF